MHTMALYIICDIISLIFLYLGIKQKKKKKIYIFLSTIPLLLLIILRSPNVGKDYSSVANAYTRISNDIITNSDIRWFGYPLIYFCKLLAAFNLNYYGFYAIIGILTILFLYKAILNNSKYPYLSLFLFICFCLLYQAMNQSRQILALCIIMYAYKYILDKKLIKYILLILLASIFHNTALIFIPMYFLRYLKFDWKTIVIYTLVTILVIVSFSKFDFLLSYTKYSIYFDTIYNVSYTESSIFNTIVRLVLLITCLFFKNKLLDDKNTTLLYHFITICTILQIVSLKFYFFGRLTTYFYVFYIYLIPIIFKNILKKLNINIRGIVYFCFIVIMCLYNFVYYNSSSGASGSGYESYETIFDYMGGK